MAPAYDRRAAPRLFARPARHLVALLDLPTGGRVLDVGAGTGVAALGAMKSLGPAGIAVGLDPSRQMLGLARSKGLARVVCGVAPYIPFRDGVFDGVLASFVLNHFASYELALTDMVRVLRPGVRLGVTSWGPLENEFRDFWRSLLDSVIGKEVSSQCLGQAIPWEQWFSDPSHLRGALEHAGLASVDVEERSYRTRMTIAGYLAMREVAMQARLARRILGAEEWERLRGSISRAFHSRFREPIVEINRVHFGVGVKP